ncbi:MAG TPA: bifunctional 5,10-methylenetetrahydrofolate dehydrogenase/5,10-methenyltetrahydrofolate cyclohydrolase, partial [Cyclobacteriaceae bacterium]|nr:bifunctional 5,10-methylenetetrahydrofolate dehydrogenase/5,10-methenyltetrahydrofolate cyclohydrolase [Cyclobacteriaceae bacterium]
EEDVTEKRLLQEVERLNEDTDVDGFIVQLPLPKHISEQKMIEAINYKKDVDGFHPINVGRLCIGLPCYVSATPMGIMELLKRYNIATEGKNCVVVGASRLVGAPLSMMLVEEGKATVTICHKYTKDISMFTRQADILVVAVGKPGIIKADMVKEGAVVIDVGTTRVEGPQYKNGFALKGDVEFKEVAPKTSFITPVPGGVGPMTIASLLLNTLRATELRNP